MAAAKSHFIGNLIKMITDMTGIKISNFDDIDFRQCNIRCKMSSKIIKNQRRV